MQTKIVEIRDKGTTIPAVAICPGAEGPREERCPDPTCTLCQRRQEREEAEMWAWRRSGYGPDAESQSAYVLLYPIDPSTGAKGDGPLYDPYRWQNKRTMQTAHRWITEHFAEIESGAVVDVEFILGETDAPKTPDRLREAARQ